MAILSLFVILGTAGGLAASKFSATRTVAGGSLIPNELRGLTPPTYPAGTVVHSVSVHRVGALLAPASPSDPYRLEPWGTASANYTRDHWQLVGEDGRIAKEFYRDVTPGGVVVMEVFFDAEAGVEYIYDGLVGLRKVPRSGRGPGPVRDADYLESLLAQGFRLVGRGQVAGFPSVVLERSPDWPLDEGGPCFPAFYFSDDAAGRPMAEAGPGGSVCPMPADFQPSQMVLRGILSEEPFGIPLGGDYVIRGAGGREFLQSGSRVEVWETISLAEAPPELLSWQPPVGVQPAGE